MEDLRILRDGRSPGVLRPEAWPQFVWPGTEMARDQALSVFDMF
jgi:hypothetical protein